jgi:hypothetical protein
MSKKIIDDLINMLVKHSIISKNTDISKLKLELYKNVEENSNKNVEEIESIILTTIQKYKS